MDLLAFSKHSSAAQIFEDKLEAINNMDSDFSHYNYRIYVYGVKYNILSISSGMGAVKYSS